MKPQLIINEDVYDEIMFYVNKSQYEVSGMGKVVVEDGGILRVVSQIMLPQKNRTTHTQVEPEDINKLLFELQESPRFWWHSHVNMGVFWSQEDMDTIKANAGPNGWFINTVFNQKKEMKTAYFQSQGMVLPWGNNPIWYDDVPTKIDRIEVIDPRHAVWEAIYNKNVTNVAFTNYNGYDWQRNRGGNVAGEPRESSQSVRALTTTSTRAGTNATGHDFNQQPPTTCPPGMKKKTYKHWVKAWNSKAWNTKVYSAGLAAVQNPDEYLEGFGFTPAEKKVLLDAKFTIDDIDFFSDEDFSPSEIVMLARHGQTREDVTYYLAMKLTSEDVIKLLEEELDSLQNFETEADKTEGKLQVGL